MTTTDIQLLDFHNRARLRPLVLDPGLARVATDWVARLARAGVLSHAFLDQRIRAAGLVLRTWGENAAWGPADAEGVTRLWLSSPAHRRNIQNPQFTRVGFGHAVDLRGTIWWCADFGG